MVIEAVVSKGQYALGLIGMLGAAIAAFAYLRVALLMYVAPDTGQAGVPAPAGEDADAELQTSDLRDVVIGGLASRDTALALRTPPTARIRMPPVTTAAIAICVAFTIFAGISTPVLSMAQSISLPW